MNATCAVLLSDSRQSSKFLTIIDQGAAQYNTERKKIDCFSEKRSRSPSSSSSSSMSIMTPEDSDIAEDDAEDDATVPVRRAPSSPDFPTERDEEGVSASLSRCLSYSSSMPSPVRCSRPVIPRQQNTVPPLVRECSLVERKWKKSGPGGWRSRPPPLSGAVLTALAVNHLSSLCNYEDLDNHKEDDDREEHNSKVLSNEDYHYSEGEDYECTLYDLVAFITLHFPYFEGNRRDRCEKMVRQEIGGGDSCVMSRLRRGWAAAAYQEIVTVMAASSGEVHAVVAGGRPACDAVSSTMREPAFLRSMMTQLGCVGRGPPQKTQSAPPPFSLRQLARLSLLALRPFPVSLTQLTIYLSHLFPAFSAAVHVSTQLPGRILCFGLSLHHRFIPYQFIVLFSSQAFH